MSITHKLAQGLALSFVLAVAQAAPAQDKFSVSAKTVNALSVTKTHRAPAEVISLNRSEVAAETDGVARSVRANPGDRVAAGDLLIALDTTDLELDEKRIRADIASTRA